MKNASLSATIPYIATLVLGGLVLAADARADTNLNCDAYAAAAVAQNQQNIAWGCGLTGLAWSNDLIGHRNWCLAPATKMPNLTHEDNARTSALAQCGDRLTKGNIGDFKPGLQSEPLSPVDLLGLNPQPEPPKPADLFGLNPQPEPPKPADLFGLNPQPEPP
jgi:hypothetical protein